MAELKRRAKRYEEIKGIGPTRAEQLRDEVGSLENLTRGGKNATKNRLASATSAKSQRDLPGYARNIVDAKHGRERDVIDAVKPELVSGEQSDGPSQSGNSGSGSIPNPAKQRKQALEEGDFDTSGVFTDASRFGEALKAFSDEYQGSTTYTGPDPREMREGVEESDAPEEFVSAVPSAINQRTFLQFPTEENFEQNVAERVDDDDESLTAAKDAFVNFVDRDIGLGGGMLTVGEFEVSESAQEEARDDYATRSPEAKQVDRRRRAPVTTNAEQYERRPGRLDFPGIDTPTERPKVKQKDRQTVDAEDTTLEENEGSLFVRENNTTGGTIPSLEGLLSGGRSPDRGTTNQAASFAETMLGVDTDEPSGGDAIADITFLERDKDGFGEELIPFGAEQSDKNRFEFM